MRIFLPQKQQRRRSKRWRRSWLIVLGILCILAGAGFALRETRVLVVQDIVVEGQKRLVGQEVADAAKAELQRPLMRFVHPNMLLFPEERLQKELFLKFPRIANMSIERSFFKRIVRISITEREQAGIYCIAQPALEDGSAHKTVLINGCYLIDDQGVIFAEAPETEGGLILSLVDLTNTEVFLGQEALSPEVFGVIKELWDMFRTDVGVGVSRLLRQNGNVLVVQTLEGWEALFDMSWDIKAQAVALRELLAKELPPQKRVTVTTIDLRIPGKIYYR